MKLVGKFSKTLHKTEKPISKQILLEHLSDAKEFIEKEVNAELIILEEKDSKHQKASQSLPNKPSIVIE